MSALRTLLSEIVDYAGLFPPAALDMSAAVRNYAAYRDSADAWMLGRFVVPASRLDAFAAAIASLPVPPSREWPVSALIANERDVAAVRAFNDAHRGVAKVDTLEAKLATTSDAARFGSLGSEFAVFGEVPPDRDVVALVASIRDAGINAKVRTGGVVAEAIPAPDQVIRFIRACLDQRVPFKATAGLHHPLRATYPLTYDANAPTGMMFGYLNVFLAAAFMANGMGDADALRLLAERDATAFATANDELRWRGHVLTAQQLKDVRGRVATSFGSCSFREPVDELRGLPLTV